MGKVYLMKCPVCQAEYAGQEMSAANAELAALRAEVERLLKEHRNICGALGEFYDNHEGAHTALEKIHILKTELDALRADIATLTRERDGARYANERNMESLRASESEGKRLREILHTSHGYREEINE